MIYNDEDKFGRAERGSAVTDHSPFDSSSRHCYAAEWTDDDHETADVAQQRSLALTHPAA